VYSTWATVELVESATRSGAPEDAADALERLSETTRASGSDWALGTEAAARAQLSEGESAERLYREALERLGRTRIRWSRARTHLLYGEWLRRERRRVEAREHLRTAQEMFRQMGAEAFAERAERELLATRETARRRAIDSSGELTPHQLRVALMARDGASNQEIAARLSVSRKTVEYHMHNVLRKLGIASRERLDRVLPPD